MACDDGKCSCPKCTFRRVPFIVFAAVVYFSTKNVKLTIGILLAYLALFMWL